MRPLRLEDIAALRKWYADVRQQGLAIGWPPAACYMVEVFPRLLDDDECARALLKRIEWSAIVVATDDEDQGEEMQACPECLARQRDGHLSGCELDALIGPGK